jgi:hypothetical protein
MHLFSKWACVCFTLLWRGSVEKYILVAFEILKFYLYWIFSFADICNKHNTSTITLTIQLHPPPHNHHHHHHNHHELCSLKHNALPPNQLCVSLLFGLPKSLSIYINKQANKQTTLLLCEGEYFLNSWHSLTCSVIL